MSFDPVREYANLCIVEALKGSSDFSESHQRIRAFFAREPDKERRIRFLRLEYGRGIRPWFGTATQPCTISSVNYDSTGHTVFYTDENGSHKAADISYAQLADAIEDLIEKGEYR